MHAAPQSEKSPLPRPIARMGYENYARTSETFEMRIPSATRAAEDGLKGKTTREKPTRRC